MPVYNHRKNLAEHMRWMRKSLAFWIGFASSAFDESERARIIRRNVLPVSRSLAWWRNRAKDAKKEGINA